MAGTRRLAWVMLLLCAPALAQPSQPEDILPLSELDDPIGVDGDSRGLEQLARTRAADVRQAALADEAERGRYGPEPSALSARSGEVLSAAGATREVRHRVELRLAPGRAHVRVDMEFEAPSTKPSELRYRLPLPSGAVLTELQVCGPDGCRAGRPDAHPERRLYDAGLLARPAAGPAKLPIARAVRVRDERGDAVLVYAAPVLAKRPLSVRLSYAAAAAVHGGVVRFELPARGMDPQIAASELQVAAPGLLDARVGTRDAQHALQFDPWLAMPVRASLPAGRGIDAMATHVRCGRQLCASAAVWAGPRPALPADLVIALDVSPSTEGPARGRLLSTVSALLAAAPSRTRVWALAFAGEAQALLDRPTAPGQVELAPFARAIAEAQLGSATRFEAVWRLAGGWLGKARRPETSAMIAIVGDGGLTRASSPALAQARAAGVKLIAINASDQATADALVRAVRGDGLVLELGAEAEAAAHGRDPAALQDRMAAVFAPTATGRVVIEGGARSIQLGALRAGEALLWRGVVHHPFALQFAGRSVSSRDELHGISAEPAAAARAIGAPTRSDASEAAAPGNDAAGSWIAVDTRDLDRTDHDWPPTRDGGQCERRGPARRFSGVNGDAAPIGLAQERSCGVAQRPQAKPTAQPGAPTPGAGMPSEPLLAMLRQRIMPVARGCFRRDRAGQLQYQKRAVFAFTLAEREVTNAYIEGAIPAALRSCLLAAVDQLDVPRFTGIVKVRYPLTTESVERPEQIELRAQTSGELNQLFGDPGDHVLDAQGASLHTPPASNAERVRR